MRASEKKAKMAKQDKIRLLLIFVTALMCALCIFTLLWYLRTFLPVKEFSVNGSSAYDDLEIIEASGVKTGDKLYTLELEEIEERLKQSCPYIDEVEVSRQFPNKLRFDITDKTVYWYIELSGDYYSLDEELEVIEETVTNEKFVNAGAPQLKLPSVKRLMVGEKLSFGDNERDTQKICEMLATMQTATVKPRITLVDAQSRFNVNIVIDGKYHVYMGDTSNIAEKLRAVEEILSLEELKNCAGAEIDASVPETTAVKRIYNFE